MARWWLIALLGLLVSGCLEQPDRLARIQERGELVVATRVGATTYYEGARGAQGFELELARAFAEDLGVKLRLVVPEHLNGILPLVESGQVDLAAAGLPVTPDRRRRVRFGPVYHEVSPQLIYRMGQPRPPSIGELDGVPEVVQGSSHEQLLRELEVEHPTLSWRTNARGDSEETLYKVWSREIDYTIANSNEVDLTRRFYPELRVAFPVGPPLQLAWAFSRDDDASLYQEARRFFARIEQDGRLALMLDRHYGHVDGFDYVGAQIYRRHIESRLPKYLDLFQRAGQTVGLDWRLLAAIGYQESHWDPDAVSPTGVRGIMMLTKATTRFLGLDNRLDPAQSISGGATYLNQMRERIGSEVPEPDRTWLALASYNVGYGHLQDARQLARDAGADPNRWMSVKKFLPLLSQKKWYKKTRHGYARGGEPVVYVENIRSYYDILVWNTERPLLTEDSGTSSILPATGLAVPTPE